MIDPSEALASDTIRDALQRLYAGDGLSRGEANALFTALVEGRLNDAEIASMLVALRLKGETVDELVGAAQALRAADRPFERPDYLFADCCGTGGDGSGSINVSTAVAFVVAAAGLPIAKHGNRSISSRCGSADVLEQLGAKLDVEPEKSRRLLDEVGVCFLFAPLYHPGLKYAGPIRRALKVRTIMNVLGPCLNPAEPPVQLLGVADPKLLEPVAEVLDELGVKRALIVHGAGLDEIALHGETTAIFLKEDGAERMTISPADAGLETAPIEALSGGDPGENAQRLMTLFEGRGSTAERDVVALNAGALLMTAGVAADLKDGTAAAADALESGAALARLHAFVEASHG
ncbi:MAG TPA: anthranilate phosphoribosyltransferase [Sphingomicrobium sp.]|nr:anthranilate phosphoribosyltransferase [Sphingomicrobium sp.]